MRLACSDLCPAPSTWRPAPTPERSCWRVTHQRESSVLVEGDCGGWRLLLPRRRAHGGGALRLSLPSWRAHVALAMPPDPPRPDVPAGAFPSRKAYLAAWYIANRGRVRALQRDYRAAQLARRKARDAVALVVGHA